MSSRSIKISPDSIPSITRSPGVYLFRDPDNAVLYVGKAKDLRQRLSSYLRPSGDLAPKTRVMLGHASTFEIVATATEKEALILEATLIKEHRPRYNIVLRDDKAYPLLRIDAAEPFPAVRVVRKRTRDGALYYGPYPSGGAVRETLRVISSIFHLRTCTTSSLKGRSRPCLKAQIGLCCAPCTGAVTEDEYRERVEQVCLFLEGKTSRLVDTLKKEMEEASRSLEFERAAVLRDRIRSLEAVAEQQSMVGETHADLDVIGVGRQGTRAAVSLLRVRNGILKGQEIHHFAHVSDEPDSALLSVFLRQYYGTEQPPGEIVLPEETEDAALIEDWLSEGRGRVSLKVLVRGMRRRLREMAEKNAHAAIEALGEKEHAWMDLSALVRETLGLSRAPEVMEGVDITTTGGELSMGSLVRFRGGKPEKKGYRRYSIKGFAGMNDVGMIREVMERRLSSGITQNDLPDLFLIDGGPGQLSSAMAAVEGQGLSAGISVVSLAKEARKEGEKIHVPGKSAPLFLPAHHPVLLLLQRVRDEAHRFGITHHRKMREATRLRSAISDIPGVGPKRKLALLRHFGSIAGIRKAAVEELSAIPGISASLARKIKENIG